MGKDTFPIFRTFAELDPEANDLKALAAHVAGIGLIKLEQLREALKEKSLAAASTLANSYTVNSRVNMGDRGKVALQWFMWGTLRDKPRRSP